MKHFTQTALTLAALSLTSAFAQTATPAMPHMAPGSFHTLAAPTSGTASLVTKNGQTTLELKNLKTEVGPDLKVWLYEDAAPQKGAKDADIGQGKYLKVGELKKFKGNFAFALPKGTDVTKYKSVVIWCDQVKTAFGAADLK